MQKIVQDSEDIVKKTLERAVASNEDVDSYGDVSKIFKIVSEAMLKPGSSMNSEISDMVSEIAGTYSAGLEEMKQVNDEDDRAGCPRLDEGGSTGDHDATANCAAV